MKVRCYLHGDDEKRAAEHAFAAKELNDKDFEFVAERYVEENHHDATVALEVIVEPADDEARALPGWLDDGEELWRGFIVTPVVTYDAREVVSFNPLKFTPPSPKRRWDHAKSADEALARVEGRYAGRDAKLPEKFRPTYAESVHACLVLVRELLADPSRWVQKAGMGLAVDAHGQPCAPRDDKAVRFELLGAVDRFASDEQWFDVGDALQNVIEEVGKGRSIVRWHADASHADVLALLDRAIDLAGPKKGDSLEHPRPVTQERVQGIADIETLKNMNRPEER